MDMVAQPHTSMTLGYHMDGASLRGRFIFTAWVGKRSTGKGCQRRKPKARSTESVYRGRFHHTASAWKDKSWARTAIARAVAKLVKTPSGFPVSVPPFPVQVCGSSRRALALHPPSCSLGPRAQPRVWLPVPKASSAVVQLCDLGSDCWERAVWERAGRNLTGRLSSSLGSCL